MIVGGKSWLQYVEITGHLDRLMADAGATGTSASLCHDGSDYVIDRLETIRAGRRRIGTFSTATGRFTPEAAA